MSLAFETDANSCKKLNYFEFTMFYGRFKNALSRHLAGTSVELQLMTSCPTLCPDQALTTA